MVPLVLGLVKVVVDVVHVSFTVAFLHCLP